MKYDLTELSGLDDLHDASGVIEEAQMLLSALYETRKSYFLVNGSTVGNLAMILAVCNEGDVVLVQRNCHKSILHGLMLANVKPVFISPEMHIELSVPAGISADTVKQAFEQYPKAKACILTYPDYYGGTFDLKTIIDTAHQHGSLVLIDEAHGPHFKLGDPFPTSALDLGADIVVHSAHKILPAMTMGSYLHINSEEVTKEKVEFYLSVLQSSSPSYPIMASLDIARSYLADFTKKDIAYTYESREKFIREIQLIPGLQARTSDDPLKITLRHPSFTGYELQSAFEQSGIYPELADPYQVLLILPLLKQGIEYPFEQALERILKACQTNQLKKQLLDQTNTMGKDMDKINELSLTYKEMDDRPFVWVSMDQAAGKIAAKMLIPYPPGIPLLMPGEKVTSEQVLLIQNYLLTNARFQGGDEQLKVGKIAVFK